MMEVEAPNNALGLQQRSKSPRRETNSSALCESPRWLKVHDWEINLSVDERGNLVVDVARFADKERKIFLNRGASATTEDDQGGKVGDGKRKREDDSIDVQKFLLSKKQRGYGQKFFSFSALPPELQVRVFEFLPPRDVMCNVSRVCKDWSNLLTEDSVWHTLHVIHFGRIQRPGKTWKLQCREVMQRIARQEHRTQRKLFFWAARYGYIELVRTTLKQCPSLINRRNKWGIPALCKAAKKGHTDIVELLLAHPDANVNIETDLHTTALCMVADKGNVEMAKLLIDHGADVNIADNNGRTPLRRAASKGYKKTVQLLVANGADVNTSDIFGSTALYRAAYKGAVSMIRLLLSLGADVTMRNAEGETPLFVARKLGYREAAEVLAAATAKAEAERKKKEAEQRAQDQMDMHHLPPLSPLSSSFGPSLATYSSPSSSSYSVTSLFNGLHGSSHTPSHHTHPRLPRHPPVPFSPLSSPTTSPPNTPPPTPTTPTTFLTRPSPSRPMAIVNNNNTANRNNNNINNNPPFLWINPSTAKMVAISPSATTSAPTAPLSTSPPRAMAVPLANAASPTAAPLLVMRQTLPTTTTTATTPPTTAYMAHSASAFGLPSHAGVLRVPPPPPPSSSFSLSAASSSSSASLSSPSSSTATFPPRQPPSW